MEQRLKMNSWEISDTLLLCRKSLSALSDETRQQIVVALLESDQNGLRVGDLTDKTRLSRPSVSHHLQILKEAELIDMRRDGTRNYYFIHSNQPKWQMLTELLGTIYAEILNINQRGMGKGY